MNREEIIKEINYLKEEKECNGEEICSGCGVCDRVAYLENLLHEIDLRERIYLFMRKKNEFFEKITGKRLNYFTEKDKDLFFLFNKRRLDITISQLKKNIIEFLEDDYIHDEPTLIDLIGAHLCPFCIIYIPKLCPYCPYGQRKGICSDADSVYKKEVRRALTDYLNEERMSLKEEEEMTVKILRELSDILS